jgi:hypothetical protein
MQNVERCLDTQYQSCETPLWAALNGVWGSRLDQPNPQLNDGGVDAVVMLQSGTEGVVVS